MEPKWRKNRCKNRSKNRCLLKSIFDAILVDFGRENGGKLAPKSDQKSKPPLKRKNQLNISRLMFSWLSGLQVGSKNRSKIDQKSRSTWEGIKASILERFWWILGGKLGSKIEQKSIQKGIEKVMKKRTLPKWQKSRSKTPRGAAPAASVDPRKDPPLLVGATPPPLQDPYTAATQTHQIGLEMTCLI